MLENVTSANSLVSEDLGHGEESQLPQGLGTWRCVSSKLMDASRSCDLCDSEEHNDGSNSEQ